MSWDFAEEARQIATEFIAEAGVDVTLLRPPSYPVVKAVIETGWDRASGGPAQLPTAVQEYAGRHAAALIYFDANTVVQVGEMVSWQNEAGQEFVYTLHEAHGLKSGIYETLRPFVALRDSTQG